MPTVKPAGFWSYVHQDDEDDDNRITRLVRKICSEYSMVTGVEIDVFVDSDIRLGEEWQARIDKELSGTVFFIPVVTPRYFQSDDCRKELITFAGHARSLGVGALLMPLLYVRVPGLDEDSEDEAVGLIAKTQYYDWTSLRLEDETSSEYRQGINRLVQRLVEVSEETGALTGESGVAVADGEKGDLSQEEEEPGIIDILAESEAALTRTPETLQELTSTMEQVNEAMTAATAHVNKSDVAGKGFAGRLVAARNLALALNEPSERILELGTSYASDLVSVDSGVLTLIRLGEKEIADGAVEEDVENLRSLFTSIKQLSEASEENSGNIDEFLKTLEQTAQLSKDLRAPLKRMREGLRRMRDGQSVMREWVRLIDQLELA